MIKSEVLDAMVAAGCTAEQIAAAVKADQASDEERRAEKRAKDAERQRRHRERNAVSRVTGVTNGDGPLDKEAPQTPKEINPPRSDPKGSSLTPAKALEREFNDVFWPEYPRKAGKREALKAYISARKRASLETIMAGVRRYAAERAGEDPTKTKHAQGWLNGDRWLDEPTPKPRGQSPPRRKETPFDALADISRLKGWTDEPRSLPGNHEDAERLPAVGGGPSGPSVDLRRGHDWHSGSGDH